MQIITGRLDWTVGKRFPDRSGLTALGFEYHDHDTRFLMLILPFWFLVIVSGSLAMFCQLRWPPRFTLRSLFVAMTFLAVVLGMIVWLDRAWIGK
jgi:hypothetical protein